MRRLIINKISLCIQCLLLILCFSFCDKAYGQLPQANKLENFTIAFEKFTPSQHAKISAFYIQFSGYKQHTLITQTSESTVVSYISNAPIDMLVNNFMKTAQYLDMEILVRGANSQISLRFIKQKDKSLPYKEW
jgi:hypothetical protein